MLGIIGVGGIPESGQDDLDEEGKDILAKIKTTKLIRNGQDDR